MNETPSGPLASAVAGLMTLISNVTFFQTWTNTANATEALASVFAGEVGFPIAAATVSNGVLILQTRDVHNMTEGQVVTIQGSSLGAQSQVNVDGVVTLAGVTTNTVTIDGVDAPNFQTGYSNPDDCIIIPCARPFAVVCEDTEPTRSRNIGTGGAVTFAGSLVIYVEADVSSGNVNDPVNAKIEADNYWGQFVQGLMETQDTGDLMVLNDLNPLDGPTFTARDEQDDNTKRFERWRATMKVTWGLES